MLSQSTILPLQEVGGKADSRTIFCVCKIVLNTKVGLLSDEKEMCVLNTGRITTGSNGLATYLTHHLVQYSPFPRFSNRRIHSVVLVDNSSFPYSSRAHY